MAAVEAAGALSLGRTTGDRTMGLSLCWGVDDAIVSTAGGIGLSRDTGGLGLLEKLVAGSAVVVLGGSVVLPAVDTALSRAVLLVVELPSAVVAGFEAAVVSVVSAVVGSVVVVFVMLSVLVSAFK